MERVLWNQLLMLKMVDHYVTITRSELIQRVFLLQVEGRGERRKTFNYAFHVVSKQPVSMEVNEDLKQLEKEGYVSYERVYKLTPKGRNRLRYYLESIKKERVDSFMVFMDYKAKDRKIEDVVKDTVRKKEIWNYEENPYTIVIPQQYNRETGKSAKRTIQLINEMLDKVEQKYLQNEEKRRSSK